MEISRDEFNQWMGLIRQDIAGINARLDVLNGRTRLAETAIAVLQNERESDMEKMKEAADKGRDITARLTGYGALVLSGLTVLIDYFKHRP